jgi:hypothetical protein
MCFYVCPVCWQGSEKAAQRMAQLQARLFGPKSSRGAGDAGTHIQQADRQRDLFLAQLGDVLSRAIRHVVVPPTATWHEGDAVWHSPAEVRLPTKVILPTPLLSGFEIAYSENVFKETVQRFV